MSIPPDDTSSKSSFGSSGLVSFVSFVLLPIFAFALGWSVAETNFENRENIPPETELVNGEEEIISESNIDSLDVSLLKDALSILQQRYVDPEEIDPEKMKYGIVRGLVWSLEDPYSAFMSPEESSEFEHELGGDLEGIGAELTVRDGAIVVVSPLRDSPAERAGLLPEDIILEVDGEEALSSEFLSVVKRIRGKKGTEVTIGVFRPDTREKLDIVITRDEIRVETVKTTWEEDIVVLEVSQFGTNTEAEFDAALADALAKNPKAIILDLRFNSGGLLETAQLMVSAFQKSGKVVVQKGRPGEVYPLYVTGNVKTDLPLVVLQNAGSASASEIVAGALQDHERAAIIGEQSFGKGTVQELIPMRGGAHLRVTIAKWYTPNNTNIGEVGITPDLEVARTPEDIKEERDPQLDMALRYLGGESVEDLKKELEEQKELSLLNPSDLD